MKHQNYIFYKYVPRAFRVLASLLLIVTPVTTRSLQQAGASTVIFAVSSASMEPVVIINRGRYLAPKKFDTKLYYRPGRKYRLLFGGGEVGKVTVKSFDKESSFLKADVELQTSAKLTDAVWGLATNSASLGQGQSSRREPTEAERTAVAGLAQKIYRPNGAPPSPLQRMKTVDLTATDLDGDGKVEIIGTFRMDENLRSKIVAHTLFMVAEMKGDAYTPALVEQHDEDMSYNQETAPQATYFVDQLDLDGDGEAEIIATLVGSESWMYLIYRRQAGQWHIAYKGGGGSI